METTPLISYHEAYDHVNKSDLEQFMVKSLVLLNHLNVSQDILYFLVPQSPCIEVYVHCIVERDQDNCAKKRFE